MARILPPHVQIRRESDATAEQIDLALDAASLDPKASYSDQVFAQLRHAIVRGRLVPGTALSEAAVAGAIGISRQPVREALRMLAQAGLVNVYPQVGTVIAPIHMDLIREGHFVRSSLESANLLELAATITRGQLAEVKKNLAAQHKALAAGKTDEFFVLDEAMHRRFFEFTGRDRIWTLIESTKVHLDRVRWLLLERIDEHAGRALREHEMLVEKLAARDGPALVSAVQFHIDAVAEHLLDLRKLAPAHYFVD